MKGFLYSVFDSKGGFHLSPFPAANDAVAARQFGEFCTNPETPMNKHPEDYSLKAIGSFDDESGAVGPIDHRSIAHASTYVIR